MATFEDLKIAEKKELENLCRALETRAHDLNSLVEVLAASQSFQGIDALSHIKKALRNYLEN